MHCQSQSMLGLLLALCWQQGLAVDKTRDAAMVSRMDLAATQLDRLALVPNDEDWVFDFTAQKPYYSWAPGGVTNMNAATFAAGRKNGLTMAMVNLGPCCMLPPHLHPRAANYVVATLGNTTTYMWEENGAHLITTNLTPGKATLFPAGAMHMMVNTVLYDAPILFNAKASAACDKAQLVSSLISEDAGTLNIAAVFTNGFPAEYVNAAFGGNFVNDSTRDAVPPVGTGANWGTDECMKRCNIKPNKNSVVDNDETGGRIGNKP